MRLNEIQKRFTETMLDHPRVLDNPPEDLAAVFQTGDIALSDRLKVYRNNIVGSLTDVMLAGFPVVEKLVGRKFFEGMARSFILENPPSRGCLTFYGAGFAEFIEGFEPAKGLAYLPDIARLEIAMNDAYYAHDDEALSAEALGMIPPENLADTILPLRHAVNLLESRYPLYEIRDFALSDGQNGELNVNKGGVYLMIDRENMDSRIVLLEESEFMALKTLKNGVSLGESVENTLNTFPNFDFQAFLQKHLSLETFAAITPNTEL